MAQEFLGTHHARAVHLKRCRRLFPQTFAPDGSNLGLTGFANQRTETWSVRGWSLAAAATCVPLASNTPPRVVAGVEGVAETRWLPLAEGWWALMLRGTAVRAAHEIQLVGTAEALLTDVLLHRVGAFQSLATGWSADKLQPKKLPPLRVGKSGAPLVVATAAPRWYLFRSAEIGHTPENSIVTLTTDQPWRLNIRGFPPELGVLFVRAVSTE